MAAKWTFLVFIAGDNDLEGSGYHDIDEMKMFGSNTQVKVLVQFDNLKEQTVKRYLIEKNNARCVQVLSETNTGDPAVLQDFITWAMQKYPAEHYLVDVWNHGGGWEDLPEGFDYDSLRGTPVDHRRKVRKSIFLSTVKKVTTDPQHKRYIAVDVTARDYLDNLELKKALTVPNRKIDVVGFNACLMNMLEVAYEIKDCVNFIVGSEETEPGAGWAYNKIFETLFTDPNISPPDLARAIVQCYAESYPNNRNVTQSALDISKIKQVVAAVDELGKALTPEIPAICDLLSTIRNQVQYFTNDNYVDLYDLASLIMGSVEKASIKSAAEKVRRVISNDAGNGFVLHNFRSSDLPYAYGVSIYFPRNKKTFAPNYDRLDFTRDYPRWYNFLTAYTNYSPVRGRR
ncbi:MAG TPA: clostripain-related cysteine peptidase [Candidatus Limnocylindrales bacterium]|nr:clostripain-related cysteine peptidase [Candidatus Limnocylindrales bacterium]